jgi:hypothetical protein
MGGLGFRDIELFNLALLARQGWRLLQNPSSLSARILKARYFPEVDIVKAELGSNPSQVWRGIHEGLDILKQGLIRRIGTGHSTNARNDNWIPRVGTMRPITSPGVNAPSSVGDCINQDTLTWNSEKLNLWFLPMDVAIISNIPLSTRQ